MASEEKIWHPNFIEYMWRIIRHPNYTGLAIQVNDGNPKWIATAKSKIGMARKQWADEKANELGIPIEAGVYAKVMYAIHPTKLKTCQICGIEMSISYIYPNVNFVKSLIDKFGIEIDVYDSLYDVWDNVISNDNDSIDLIKLINAKFGTNFQASDSKDMVIKECEVLCRLGGKSHLGPGAMSNFPDRYDGFHTYNRCHRSSEDKGRSKENMKSYTRDRRAYEYWSDGNILAANQFMGSKTFHGISADHVGPISLGFIHDSHYLRPMLGSDNSSKRDRLTVDIVKEVLQIQEQTGVYPMSWYSSEIWNFITNNYDTNPEKVAGQYRGLLKQSMSNYMYILKEIMEIGDEGISFLVNSFIYPKRKDFQFIYVFDELGNIVTRNPRNITQRASGEFERFARIALAAINDYSDKDNRNVSQNLTATEQHALSLVTKKVMHGDKEVALTELRSLVIRIQNRLISDAKD